jgi:hypothetical protein
MAEAFRKMLRKPDFAGAPLEESERAYSPDVQQELINRELADEGRDIRSVSSSRNVKLETLEGGDVTPH